MAKHTGSKLTALRQLATEAFLFLGMAAFIFWLIQKWNPQFFPVLLTGDRDALEQMIQHETGFYAVLFTIGLEYIQTFSIIIPGAPVNIAAGLVLGGFIGTIVCTIGFVSANVAVFALARKLHGLLERFIPSTGKINPKWKFISESEHPSLMIILAYGIPIMPNGFIPYIAAKSSISTKGFSWAVFFGGFPGIMFSNFMGHFIVRGHYKNAIILGLIWIGCFILFLMNRNHLYKWAAKTQKKRKS